MHRLYHDFNKLVPGKREGLVSAPLVCVGTKEDLDKLRLTLEEGMVVLLYQPDAGADGSPDDLEVIAKIRYDDEEHCFMADFVWDELMYRSEVECKEK